MSKKDQECILADQLIEIMELIQFIFKNATKDIDITYPQFMLMKILQSKQPMTVGGLVKLVGIDQGNCSNMCKKLEKKGWVSRQRNPQDERVVLLSLTDQGQDIVDRIHAYGRLKSQRVFDLLSDDEIEQTMQGVCMLIESFKQIIYQKEEE